MGMGERNGKKRKSRVLMAGVVAAAALLTGCGNSGADSEGADFAGQSKDTLQATDGTSEPGGTEQVKNGIGQLSDVESLNSLLNGGSGENYRILTGTAHDGIYGMAGEISAYDTTNANYALRVQAGETKHEISDLLYGIFIEDINFAADGGLYAEMVQNRSFEFTSLAKGNEMHAWSKVGDIDAEVVKDTGNHITGSTQASGADRSTQNAGEDSGQDNGAGNKSGIDHSDGALNENNPSYLVLTNAGKEPAGVANKGFLDGMSIVQGASYDFSIYVRGMDGYTGSVHVALTVNNDTVAKAEIPAVTDKWEKYELVLTPSAGADKGVRLNVTIDQGKAAVDMVSLFPQDTYKGRKNGLRKDLAEKLEELSPAFLRFPGGCVVEGVSIDLAYDWKDSIGVDRNGEPFVFNGVMGDVAARKMGQNIWTNERTTNDEYPSYMTYGLGFYEYFLLAEDIGAVGVPVLNCGMSCMAQGNGTGPVLGSDAFYAYVQDALDLVEFCRGDSSTKWGAVRIAMGHEEPFALKYIGIGNEDWGDNFFKHYQAFADAFMEARDQNPKMYGDVELIFTAGTDDGDSGHTMYMNAYNYAYKWQQANPDRQIADFAGAIDHHYYNAPDWFLSHTDYYDEENYSRTTGEMTKSLYGGGIPVFLGEYAAQANNLKAALSEAAYMTGLERNGDIVVMAAYAPLFGNLTATHWAPDLIWFNNHQVTPSVNYYVQQIFAKNAGTGVYDYYLEGARTTQKEILSGKVGVGTWNTAAKFDNVKIVDNGTGEVLAQDDFSEDSINSWRVVSDGVWSVADGELVQSAVSTNTGTYSTTGSARYFGDESWSNYTYTLTATKTAGSEGFLIPFAVGDKNNNFFWNIGGWNNTVSCLQQVKDGVKSDQVSGTTKSCVIKTGQAYELKIVVTDTHVDCYIDGKQYIDYDLTETSRAESYSVVSTDETGDIIVKLVNTTGNVKTFAIDIADAGALTGDADVDLVAGKSLADDNVLGREEAVKLVSSALSGVTDKFNYTVPGYSVTVLRLHRR